MARIRTIKPEFFTSEQIAECSTNARLLFVGLWCFSDDQGVHPDSPRRIKMEVFPADDFTTDQVSRMLLELQAAGLILRYEVGGMGYLHVTGWEKHQRIDRPTLRYPSPRDSRAVVDTVSNVRRQLDEGSPSPRPRNGMESKGREGTPPPPPSGGSSPPQKRGTRLPADFEVPTEWLEHAEKRRSENSLGPANLKLEAEQFGNYWRAQSGAKGCKLDWRATWVNWALKARARTGHDRGNGHAIHDPAEPFAEARFLGLDSLDRPKYRPMTEAETLAERTRVALKSGHWLANWGQPPPECAHLAEADRP